MKFTVVGTNYRRSPLEIRDCLSFSKRKLRDAFRFLKAMPDIRSFFILSTCNRSEIYVWSEKEINPKNIFSEVHDFSEEKLAPFLYSHEDPRALQHLLRVMCGLDAQIAGEPQVLGQVRQAIQHSEDMEALDWVAGEFLRKLVGLAAKIRRETQIEYASRTVVDASFDLIQRTHPSFQGKRVLLIGTGKIMGLFIPLLTREGIRPVIVSNRNHEQAVEWARMSGGRAANLEDLVSLVPESDVIVSATSCPHVVLHKEYFHGHQRPVMVLDLAVPRDAEPSIKEIAGVQLFDLDDIGLAAAKDRQQDPLRAAERMVKMESETLWEELTPRGVFSEEVILSEAPQVRSRRISLMRPFDSALYNRAPLRVSGAAKLSAPSIIRVGTRKSSLALKQIEEIFDALRRRGNIVPYEIIGMDTPGDLDKQTSISEVEGSDFFTRTLDQALLEGRIDCAIHSAKDIPDTIPDGLEVAVMTPSLEMADALVSVNHLKLSELAPGARIGVSSQRRKEQIRNFRSDLQIVDLRGTIEERLQQLDAGKYDAVILAAVALMRLGLEPRMTEKLDSEFLQPHPLQGRLAVLVREGDPLRGRFSQLEEPVTYA